MKVSVSDSMHRWIAMMKAKGVQPMNGGLGGFYPACLAAPAVFFADDGEVIVGEVNHTKQTCRVYRLPRPEGEGTPSSILLSRELYPLGLITLLPLEDILVA